jgi:hypothetical protein
MKKPTKSKKNKDDISVDMNEGKLITEPKPEIGYGLRVRNNQKNNSARKTIRL